MISDRRVTAALNYGLKSVRNPKHADMFPLNVPHRDNLRPRIEPYKEYDCKTSRFYNSSIPTITRLLNLHSLPNTE